MTTTHDTHDTTTPDANGGSDAAVAWLETSGHLIWALGRSLRSSVIAVQPMVTLKHLDDAGTPMTVDARDYADPGRWWL